VQFVVPVCVAVRIVCAVRDAVGVLTQWVWCSVCYSANVFFLGIWAGLAVRWCVIHCECNTGGLALVVTQPTLMELK